MLLLPVGDREDQGGVRGHAVGDEVLGPVHHVFVAPECRRGLQAPGVGTGSRLRQQKQPIFSPWRGSQEPPLLILAAELLDRMAEEGVIDGTMTPVDAQARESSSTIRV
jgi:hypothetical protein